MSKSLFQPILFNILNISEDFRGFVYGFCMKVMVFGSSFALGFWLLGGRFVSGLGRLWWVYDAFCRPKIIVAFGFFRLSCGCLRVICRKPRTTCVIYII